MPPNERRFSRRTRTETQGRTVSGYAAKFNTPADIGSQFIESISPGAFSRALRDKHDVRLLVNHDPSLLLARSVNGTLTLTQDAVGLHFRAQIAPTQAGNDLLTLLRSQTMSQCSFGFTVPDGGDAWSKKSHNGVMRDWREIRDCDLFDVSCVTYAAYDSTSADVDDEEDEEEEDGRGLKALAAVVGRSSTPFELRSRIAGRIATADQRKGLDLSTPAGRAEHTLRLGAQNQAERILAALK